MKSHDKFIRDAIHGDLPFSKLELSLMDTAQMQRLRGIRQLGTSNLVYPSAVHTRFEHSLGTCFMAKKIMASIEDNGEFRFDERDKISVAAAALLHDVTHIPFGHTLEDERRVFPRHDADANRLDFFIEESRLGEILRRERILTKVLSLLKKRKLEPDKDAYLQQIISHTICADLMDYIRRDAKFCGLKLDYDDRIFRYFEIQDGCLILNLQHNSLFRHDAFSEVIHLLRIRYFLTERVYYHHAKIASGAMLSRIVEKSVECGFKKETLYSLTDDALIFYLMEHFNDDPEIRRLIKKYSARELYKRVYVLTDWNMDSEKRMELSRRFHKNEHGERGMLEKRIAKAAKIPGESVIVYAPPPSMNLKEADVLARVDNGPAQPLVSWKNKEVLSLQEKFGKLWKFYVFVDPEYSQRFRVITEMCESIFDMPNELPLIQRGQLSLFPV
jgi:uncharacterized protein